MNVTNTLGSTIAVVLGGTSVAFPNNQVLGGFSVDGGNTVFAVPVAGVYMVTYRVSTTAGLLLSARVLHNGTALAGSTVSPAVSTSLFTATTFATLAAGHLLILQLFGLLARRPYRAVMAQPLRSFAWLNPILPRRTQRPCDAVCASYVHPIWR